MVRRTFVKPELAVVFDRLIAREPAKFEYWLHAINEMLIDEHARRQYLTFRVTASVAWRRPTEPAASGLRHAERIKYCVDATVLNPPRASVLQRSESRRGRLSGEPCVGGRTDSVGGSVCGGSEKQ